jgi:hypothetical protein
MIAGARRDYAAGAFIFREHHESVRRAAEFERSRELFRLELKPDIAADERAQPVGFVERRLSNCWRDARGGRTDLCRRWKLRFSGKRHIGE